MIPFADPAVLVDAGTADDAAVYRLDDERAVVATADFFTPIVDDPYDFGRIAATNALSDLYAMGATPLFALNLLCFPRAQLDDGSVGEILRGGSDAARAAGIAIIGGHSIDDPEPKYGLCAIGTVHPDRIMRNSTARPGDVLVLTKPLGTGIITTALKREHAPASAIAAAVQSMATLNRDAAAAMLRARANAATDVSGYGLIGHLCEMTLHSGVGARLSAAAVPLLPGALELARAGYVPGGTLRNLDDTAERVSWHAGMDSALRVVIADAQTSGGLLIALPADRAEALLADLAASSISAALIGELIEAEAGSISVEA